MTCLDIKRGKMSKYPRCAQCDKPLAVHVGIERDGMRFCGPDCIYLYFGPPDPPGGLVIEGAVFRADLVSLRKTNPSVDEPGILALYYLGWQHVPGGGSDYEIFSKVREWCIEP